MNAPYPGLPLKPSQEKNQSGTITKKEQFQDLFQTALEKQERTTVQFSRHAEQRMKARNIRLSTQQLKQINQGVHTLRKKGVKESLLLLDDLALVVNVKNSTVITAMGKKDSKEHVFTNIDSAVLL